MRWILLILVIGITGCAYDPVWVAAEAGSLAGSAKNAEFIGRNYASLMVVPEQQVLFWLMPVGGILAKNERDLAQALNLLGAEKVMDESTLLQALKIQGWNLLAVEDPSSGDNTKPYTYWFVK